LGRGSAVGYPSPHAFPVATPSGCLARHPRLLVERGRSDGAFRDDLPAGWLVTSLLALIHAAAADVRSGILSRDQAAEVLLTTIPDLFAPPASGR
jgi:hypothetical protein